MKIVIIEDEPLTAEDLADTLLEVEPGAQIVAVLASVKAATAYFRENPQPDLIFSDIQLGDGLSFEIFQNVEITRPVVFCTAYNEYALDAFKANGIDYILKPFNQATIQKTLQKYKQLQGNHAAEKSDYHALMQLLDARLVQKPQSVLVFQRDKIIPLPLDQMAVCYSQNLVTHAITFDQRKFTLNQNMEEMEAICGQQFFRANRQFLVHYKAIKEASQYFGRKLAITLTIPFTEEIIISKAKSPLFLTWLGSK
ncbi:LytR/AlgR family response regulator transcription factor [Rufibacter sediminis]|uniref:Response regulator transcription factor n=1 Tax=Rufibacter sediminis TaxID=2762756 RepID=A0ABR6VQ85_9BACT|nr:LytTR family DNA-binding domain-containing protein [Rufibacter sediminis]MBC3539357.1 response regulator transcription factor [Rufibacter sediminis]